ncbi:MAG: PqqD family protein [Thermoanaerobaculia bacterium]|nr:PqqD family protein [Thermoanaerobaculia bacterium]
MTTSQEASQDPCTTWRRAEHIAWRPMGEETVLVDLRTKAFYGLDSLAGHLWHLLDGRSSSVDLAARVEKVAGDQKGRAEAIEDLLNKLEEREIVVTSAPTGPVPVVPVPELPVEACFPPKLVWEEALKAVAQPGGSCGFMPGQGDQCVGFPFQ